MLLEAVRSTQTYGTTLVPTVEEFRDRITHKRWHFVGCIMGAIGNMSFYYGHFYGSGVWYEGTRQDGGFGYRICSKCGHKKKYAIILPHRNHAEGF